MIYIYQKSYWEQDAMAAYGKQNLRTKRSFRRYHKHVPETYMNIIPPGY